MKYHMLVYNPSHCFTIIYTRPGFSSLENLEPLGTIYVPVGTKFQWYHASHPEFMVLYMGKKDEHS